MTIQKSATARPSPVAGMWHIALNVEDISACERFYVDMLGMSVEWRPDEDNVYLCSGCDNLALHRIDRVLTAAPQRLDHLGFILNTVADVDSWYQFLCSGGISMVSKPTFHRDGARSFYCLDPAGNTVQLIYHPPLAEA